VLGRITRIGDAYVSLEVAPDTEISIQRAAVQMLLPKGTLKSIQ
jgi:preprotein translocase subunit YajC